MGQVGNLRPIGNRPFARFVQGCALGYVSVGGELSEQYWGKTEIGAEFMVRSFSRGNAMYIANDYVTVEVALYARKGESVEIGYLDFQLRINGEKQTGKKQTLLAQNPYIVAASVAHPGWQSERPGVAVMGGAGNARVTLGGPRQAPLPTGAPQGGGGPSIPRVPKPETPEGVDMQPAKRADEIAVEAALPEGTNRAPVAGFLYFLYTGRNKSIKQVELSRTAVSRYPPKAAVD